MRTEFFYPVKSSEGSGDASGVSGKQKKILIIGGAGYVGSALTPELLRKGYEVVVYDLYLYGDVFGNLRSRNLVEIKGDIRDKNRLLSAGVGVDQIIHLACISNDPSFELNPKLGKSINYDAFPNVIEAVKANGVKRLIYASSSSVYGVKSGEVTEDVELAPLTDYARYKMECERILEESGINYVMVRPATVCGYAHRLRLDLVVNILTIHALVNRKIRIIGEHLLRPNINIKDMVRIYECLLEADDDLVCGQVFNTGHQNMTVGEIARLIVEVLGDKGMVLENVKTDDIRSYHVNSEKIKHVLGFEYKYSVGEAILSLKTAFGQGLIIDGLNNPLYYNVKLMQKINLE